MKSFKILLPLILLATLPLTPITIEGQMALLGVSNTEVLAGDTFYAFYNITTIKSKPIVEFELTVIIPKGWKLSPYKASGITMEGKDIEVRWNGSTAFYRGDGASLAQVSFLVWVPPHERGVRNLEASGYIVVKEGKEPRRYNVIGSKQVRVHQWEPMVFLNLSKVELIPPTILKASLRILTAPPLYPTDMKNVLIKVEDSVKGVIYQEVREYWPYGTVMDAHFPLEVSQSTPGGEQKVRVTVEYEVFGERYSTQVDYTYKVIKPSKVVIESVEVTKEARLGEPIEVKVVLVNPSSFDAMNVELHAQLGDDHWSRRLGDLAPGAYLISNLTFKTKGSGRWNVTVWAIWTQEYPKITNSTERKSYEVTVREETQINTIILAIPLAVISVAATKYVLKKRGARKPEG
ncbi:MAG: hypothetical protein NZ992_02155 [Candidatus Korarchaeum sp.]|nr:hypothetical protein [Candidatus Korarchaeum sp.]MDW8036340.1 hypothetical protein [Candidatus Korarchaeum sp.]